MLNQLARSGAERVLRPIGSSLARLGVSPDLVTVIGTTGVVLASVGLVARGWLLAGAAVILVFALTDLVDGAIARASGRQSKWGAFLDSTMDRIADGAVFGALAYWLATEHRFVAMAGTIICLIAGSVVSYAKARAEGLGLQCDVGFAGRAERLIVIGLGGIIATIADLPVAVDVAIWVLTLLATWTIAQRMMAVWRQAGQA